MTAPVMFIFLGLVLAVAYFPISNKAPTWSRSALKTLPLLCFCVAAYAARAPALLALGLFLSALGDFALSRDGRAAFLYGLSTFALAHLVFIMLFLGLSNFPLWEAFAQAPILAISMLVFAASSELWLAPHTGTLRWPVRIYIVLITVMGLAVLTLPMHIPALSMVQGETMLNLPIIGVLLGAGLFILSDVILSLRLFRMDGGDKHARLAGWAVWGLYISGQFLILTGILL